MAAPVHRLYRERGLLRRERVFRDRRHPLEIFDDVELFKKFRFPRKDILEITDEITPDISHPNRRGALTPVLQVLIALRFYASGTFQDICAELIGVDQSTACRSIDRVTKALLRHVRKWICFPNQEEAERSKQAFYCNRGFPNVFGCIDGTHIRIQKPHAYEHEYVNRKNYHSINVQVICDSNLLFLNVVAKWPGSTHDSRILRESPLFEAMEGADRPISGYLLGDSGYMLRDWLLTPLLNAQTRQEQRYNEAHCSTRNTVERAIGVAKRRWHCLRRLRVQPAKACQIILVCFMLHNRCRRLNIDDIQADDSDSDSESDDEPENVPDHQVGEQARVAAGRAVRDRLINNYF